MRLENWIVVQDRICGNIYGSDKHDDGKFVTTSKVVNVDKEGKIVTTKSGSVYELCNHINSDYERVELCYLEDLINVSKSPDNDNQGV